MEVRAEQRAENRAMNDLARGDIRGYEREMNKANRIENRRQNQNFVADINDGVGMRGAFAPAAQYVAPAPYVAPIVAENRMMNAEIREEQMAAYDRATGNYIGAAIHNERARELDAARNNMEIQEEEFLEYHTSNLWRSLYTKICIESRNNDFTAVEALKPENKQLNRYRDVYPYDHSRVPLTNVP